jgi:hypothetical protein
VGQFLSRGAPENSYVHMTQKNIQHSCSFQRYWTTASSGIPEFSAPFKACWTAQTGSVSRLCKKSPLLRGVRFFVGNKRLVLMRFTLPLRLYTSPRSAHLLVGSRSGRSLGWSFATTTSISKVSFPAYSISRGSVLAFWSFSWQR